MINVSLTDDHAILREGMVRLLEDLGIAIIFQASTGKEFLEKSQQFTSCNIHILDLSLPDISGVEVCSRLKSTGDATPVIILTMHDEDYLAMRAFENGVRAFVTKDSSSEELEKAIKKVMNGEKYLATSIFNKLSKHFFNFSKSQITGAKLSNRESEVLLQLSQGKTLQEISVDLNLSAKSISTYKRRLFDKLNIKSNAQLYSFLLNQHGFLEKNKILG